MKFPGRKHDETAQTVGPAGMVAAEQTRSNTVLVGVDGSPASDDAIRWAAATASGHGLNLHLAHALNFAHQGSGDAFINTAEVFEWAEAEAKTLLERAVEVAHTVNADLKVSTQLATTSGAGWLIELSEQVRMLVLGASGVGRTGETLLGSMPIAVASHGHCPVVVVRGQLGETVPDPRPVVVGVDGTAVSERAVDAAFEEAAARHVPLVAVHVWSDMKTGTFAEAVSAATSPQEFDKSEHARLAELLASWQARYPDVQVQREVYVDGPRAHLLAWSEKAQLVVVGSRGRGGFKGLLLGSTSNALVRDAHCPVMVVRPEGSH